MDGLGGNERLSLLVLLPVHQPEVAVAAPSSKEDRDPPQPWPCDE